MTGGNQLALCPAARFAGPRDSSRRSKRTALIPARLEMKGAAPFPAQNVERSKTKIFPLPSDCPRLAPEPSTAPPRCVLPPSLAPAPQGCPCTPVSSGPPVCVAAAWRSPLSCLCSYVCPLRHHSSSNHPSLPSRWTKFALTSDGEGFQDWEQSLAISKLCQWAYLFTSPANAFPSSPDGTDVYVY